MAAVAYSAATGAVAWVARYGHAGQNSAGEGVAVSPDSAKVYVPGDTANYGTTIGYGSREATEMRGSIGVHDGCCDFGTVAYQP